jgi:biopolymer transport protein TolR
MGASLPSGSRRHGRRRMPMAEINVTPLVDVMLVLLIIFMVTAPLLVAGVPVDLPESRAGALDQQAKPVQVSIDGSGQLTIDETPVTDAQLPTQLARIAAEPQPPEGRRIYLRADKGLDYGRVMRVMGELNRAGLNRVALVSVGGDTPTTAAVDGP